MGPTSSDFEIRDIIWEMGPPMPWPTKGQAQDVIGHRIVAAGAPGYPDWKPSLEYDTDEGWRVRERGKHNSGWILDTRTMEYGFLPNLPVGISWPKGQAVGDDFFVYTGTVLWPEDQYTSASPRLFRLSSDSRYQTWEELESMRTGRFLPATAVCGTTIIVAGGQATFGADPFRHDNPGPHINALEAFDTSTPAAGWRDLPPIPGFGRQSSMAAGVGGKFYIFGGNYVNYADAEDDNHGPHARYCGDAYVLDVETLRWKRLPDLPFSAYGMGTAVYQDRYVIMIGGLRNYLVDHPYTHMDRISKIKSPNFDVLVFDTVEDTYRILPTQIPPYPLDLHFRQHIQASDRAAYSQGVYRLSAQLSLVGHTLYLCGGEVISPHNVTDDVVIGTIVEG